MRKSHEMFVKQTQKQMLRKLIRQQYADLFLMVNKGEMPVLTMSELRHIACLQLQDTLHGKDKETLTKWWNSIKGEKK